MNENQVVAKHSKAIRVACRIQIGAYHICHKRSQIFTSVHRQCRCYVTWEGSKVSSTASSNAGRTKTIELPDSFQTRIHARAMWERARPCINWQWRGLPGSPRDHIEGYIMLWLSSVHIHKVTNLGRCRPCRPCLPQVSLTHRNAERFAQMPRTRRCTQDPSRLALLFAAALHWPGCTSQLMNRSCKCCCRNKLSSNSIYHI